MVRGDRNAWLGCAVVFALLLIGAVMEIATWSAPLAPGFGPRGIALYFAPLYAILGALVISRAPGNAIGYLLLAIGAVGGVQLVAEQIAVAGLVWPAIAPVGGWAALLFFLGVWIVGIGVTPYWIALFPTGRVSSARDKLALTAATGAFSIALIVFFTTVEHFPVPFANYPNPLAIPGSLAGRYVLGAVAVCVLALAIGTLILGLVGRFQRSRGVERQQLKWFSYGATLVGAAVVAFWVAIVVEYALIGQSVFDAPPDWLRVFPLVVLTAFGLLAVAIATAILRYRLYDIDILINRTVLYGSVTGILAIAFAGLSAIAQRAVEVSTGAHSDLVTLLLVIGVALSFTPLRRRLQPLVDRALPGRGHLTLLFTDIVGSTERVVALGDERWASVLATYRSSVRRELARFGGREVDTAGDGFFATFDRPTDAVRCAVALREALRGLRLDSRIGLHVGECELRGERVSGLNVVVAARIMATAKANEIVVSNELRDLLADAGWDFRERGVESLKGVPGEWRLSSVDGVAT